MLAAIVAPVELTCVVGKIAGKVVWNAWKASR
jgi:hypothetical protein